MNWLKKFYSKWAMTISMATTVLDIICIGLIWSFAGKMRSSESAQKRYMEVIQSNLVTTLESELHHKVKLDDIAVNFYVSNDGKRNNENSTVLFWVDGKRGTANVKNYTKITDWDWDLAPDDNPSTDPDQKPSPQ